MRPTSTALAGVGKIGGYFGGCVKNGSGAIVIGVKAAPASYWRARSAASASGAVRCLVGLSTAPRRAILGSGKSCTFKVVPHSILTRATPGALLGKQGG